MRAVVQRAFGGPEVLQVVEVDDPEPIPSEVVVRVRAAGLNPVDAVVRGGWPLLGEPPFTLGWDVSGVVEAVVPGVTRFAVGDEVYGMPFFPRAAGAYAELVAAPSRQFAPKPRTLDHAHAATVPLVGLTAWQSLVDTANVGPGQRVLIHAAGGGLGKLAVQIAKSRGAYVIGTAGAARHERLRELGADELIDYRAVDFTTAVKDVDVVLETVGGGYAERSLEVLRPGGLLITVVQRTDEELPGRVEAAGRRFASICVEPDRAALEAITELIDSGRMQIDLDRTFDVEQVVAAHELLDSGRAGKLALTF